MPLFDSSVFDSPVFDGDASSGGGFGMCCGCGNTATYVPCTAIDCGSGSILTCDLPQVYRIDLDGFALSCCAGIFDLYTVGYIGLVGCYNWQNFHPDNPAYPGAGECCGRPNLCDALGLTAGWGFSMSYACGGTVGGYALTEPCFVLTVTAGSGGACVTGYYICPIAGYDCTGANVFDLVASSGTAYLELPASFTLSPAATPSCVAACLYS